MGQKESLREESSRTELTNERSQVITGGRDDAAYIDLESRLELIRTLDVVVALLLIHYISAESKKVFIRESCWSETDKTWHVLQVGPSKVYQRHRPIVFRGLKTLHGWDRRAYLESIRLPIRHGWVGESLNGEDEID